MIGIDAVEMMAGLSSHGHLIRVCQGPDWERNNALAAIEENQARGCVLDYVTLHVARRLGVIDVVVKICGEIAIVDATLQRYQHKIFEMQQTIDEPSKFILLKEGEVCRTETPIEVKREALDLLKSDAAWIERNCKVIPAEGKRDLSGDIREIVQRFGSDFVDELQAAQGSGFIFVSEDNALRVVGQSEFGVPSTWLQPIIMKAKNSGLFPERDYTKAVVAMIDAKFYFITIDPKDIKRAVADLREIALPKDFQVLASRLGGKEAELRSHITVALKALILIWPSKTIPNVAKLAVVGELLKNLVKGRPIPEIHQILGEFVRFGESVLRDFDFSQYIIDWCRGHFIPI